MSGTSTVIETAQGRKKTVRTFVRVFESRIALKAHIVTWALSVLSACIVGAAWIYTHPSPRMVRVDVGSLFDEQKKNLAEKIKPGMSEEEQKALLLSAEDYARRVDGALDVVARECDCAVVNAAAILRLPETGGASGIPDMTWRVKELLSGGR